MNICVMTAGRGLDAVVSAEERPAQQATGPRVTEVPEFAGATQGWIAIMRSYETRLVGAATTPGAIGVYVRSSTFPKDESLVVSFKSLPHDQVTLLWLSRNHLQISLAGPEPTELRLHRHPTVSVSISQGGLPVLWPKARTP
jgi:hypothetical protein